MSLLKEVFKVTLDVIPTHDTAPDQIENAVREMGFSYNGFQDVLNDSGSRQLEVFQFKGEVTKSENCSYATFECILKNDIKVLIKGFAEDIRVTIHDKRFEKI
ncbi:hypothetical protein I5P78_24735 [Serratia marcescens]|nr:hypothetical protein [Serratia marcescens]